MKEIKKLKQKLSYVQYVEYIRLNGIYIDSNIISLPEDKYSEPVLREYFGMYFIIYDVLENHMEHCHYTGYEEFFTIEQASKRYNSLAKELPKISF